MIEALGHREQERDDAERLLAMLRVTLTERRERALQIAAEPRQLDVQRYRHIGRAQAFRDVLSLLGPEETYVDDGTEPF